MLTDVIAGGGEQGHYPRRWRYHPRETYVLTNPSRMFSCLFHLLVSIDAFRAQFMRTYWL